MQSCTSFQRSWGFDDEDIYAGAQAVFEAARTALGDDQDAGYLSVLEGMLESRVTQAHEMIERFEGGELIEEVMVGDYG